MFLEKENFLENFTKFTGKHLCRSPFLYKAVGIRLTAFLKKAPVKMFSCKFCGISKNTLFTLTPPVAAVFISVQLAPFK